MPPKAKTAPTTDDSLLVNAAFVGTLQEKLTRVLANPIFSGIEKVASDSVVQAGFEPDQFKKAMSKPPFQYRCSGNIFHCQPFYCLAAGVPYNQKAIDDMVVANFAEPGDFTGMTVVLVESTSWDPVKHAGHWKRLSAEEPFFALICRIDQLMQDASTTDDELTVWKETCLRIPFQFELHKPNTQTAWTRHINLREALFVVGVLCRCWV
jgi:hypothetical protein